MRFIYPEFLPALGLIIIPILIHFIHFKRYKTVYFSQVNFLKAVKQESKKKNNLKQLLILLSRIATIIALVMVFCQPYLPTNKQERKSAREIVAIYVDNSFSMKNESDKGTLLELAKSRAMGIADSYGPGTQFMLMDNQNSASQQELLTKEQLINQLATIKEAPGALTVSRAYQLMENNLKKQKSKSEKNIYLLSDFQDYTTDLQSLKKDSASQVFLVLLQSQSASNLLIDSCWFETPGHKKDREEKLFVRVQNQSSQSYQDIPVRLTMNDTLKAINNLTIGPNEKKEIALSYKNSHSGTLQGLVELDDYPITYDNKFYFSYQVHAKNNLLIIDQPQDSAITYLDALFRNDENIKFTSAEIQKVQISQFGNYQCIFLLNLENPSSGLIHALDVFVAAGGSLAIFPGMNLNQNTMNALYHSLGADEILHADSSKIRMDRINYKHPLLSNVFQRDKNNLELPDVNYSYRFSKSQTSGQNSIIGLNNGQAALAEYTYQKGQVYCFNFPLNEEASDFNEHAIFVPVLYNIALNSFEPQQIQYRIKNNMVLTFPKTKELSNIQKIELKPEKSEEAIRLALLNEYADQIRIDLQNTVQDAGFYQLLINGSFFKPLAFNFDRNESLSPQLSIDRIEKEVDDANMHHVTIIKSNSSSFETDIQEASDGTELWKLFLILALLFIATEIGITRFWK